MENAKIINKFIPRTSSHTRTRISKIIKDIKSKEKKKKRTGIKTFKRRYIKKILNNANIKQQSIQPIQPPQPIQHPQELYQKNIFIPDMEVEKKETPMPPPSPPVNQPKTRNHFKYIIVIPSYNRADLIQVKTLALLQKNNINPKIINIFVADRDQYNLYKSKIPKNVYNKLIIGVKGLKNQRNYINNYYPEGYHIVEMDDDIDKIVQLDSSSIKHDKLQKGSRKVISKKIKPIENLDTFIKDAFQRCRSNGIFLWGVYPLANPYFMSNTITTDLRFIVGPFWGMINRHREDLLLTIDEKENSERTLQNWVIDGKVLRFNNIGIETKYYKNKGGMQNNSMNSNYRKKAAMDSVHYLHNKYPKITKINLSKKSGFPEIKLLRK